ncbi:hypothetical protein BCEP4_540047 [Burkholderia cepacia]|nr:hypothetical protein BCEP4_540047 [Burkholderia cepacia]
MRTGGLLAALSAPLPNKPPTLNIKATHPTKPRQYWIYEVSIHSALPLFPLWGGGVFYKLPTCFSRFGSPVMASFPDVPVTYITGDPCTNKSKLRSRSCVAGRSRQRPACLGRQSTAG